MKASELIPFLFSVILVVAGIFFVEYTYRNKKDCYNHESLSCPVFSCIAKDDKCGYAPYRCETLDAGSSTCSGDNKVCMVYPLNPSTYSVQSKGS